ncbi:MAG: GntR family transcriptional regulator [Anaerolineales bacterium]|nr:GntR family transcriptional regulator [Anaerolineales bacterium]
MTQLKRESPLPLYHQLKEYLVERVENGEFPADKPLPTELEIINQFSISRATVRRAMHDLEVDGYIRRIPGKGTFILRTKIKRGLSRLTSFSEDMAEHGQVVTSKLLDFDKRVPPARVTEKLGVPTDHEVTYIQRLRLVDDVPIALNISYLSLPEGTFIELCELENVASLWSLLEQKNIPIIEADKSIESASADEESALLLEMPAGAPLLVVKGIVYTTGHVPVEYHKVISCGDRYRYSLHLDR